ncbi:MAG: helix-turn-helix domain-containing protein [Patescibacteria group bacterium]
MISGFSTKKIKSHKTVGERLKNIRLRKKISLSEAEVGTKVRAKYLAAIEEGKWSELPQNVYTRGFVLAYSKFLGLNSDLLVQDYEQETLFRSKKENHKISYNQSIKDKKVLITPKLIAYTALAISILGMFSYIVFQLLNFAGNPNLKIVSPDNNIVLDNDSMDLSGITDVDAFISVNGENVPVSGDGRFILKLKLHQGVNMIKVMAVNKAKKESSQIYTVEYKPKTAAIENNLNQ